LPLAPAPVFRSPPALPAAATDPDPVGEAPSIPSGALGIGIAAVAVIRLATAAWVGAALTAATGRLEGIARARERRAGTGASPGSVGGGLFAVSPSASISTGAGAASARAGSGAG
jgi:hypothetical protein